MSLEPIERIRVVSTRPADLVLRDRRHGEQGGKRQPKEDEDEQDERGEDDGLPHIDVRA